MVTGAIENSGIGHGSFLEFDRMALFFVKINIKDLLGSPTSTIVKAIKVLYVKDPKQYGFTVLYG